MFVRVLAGWAVLRLRARGLLTAVVVSRAEGDGDYGGLPDEWHDYGDSTRFVAPRSGLYELVFDARGVVRASCDGDEIYVRESDVRLAPNDRVRVTRDVSGILFTSVPTNTEGRVVSTRSGLFASFATVRFANGRTEEVNVSDLRKLGFWD